MGNGADKIFSQLEKQNVKPFGVMASDDFVRGQLFHGYKVQKLSDFAQQISDFIILTSFGTQRANVIDNIINISRQYTLLSPDVPVYGETLFDRHFFAAHQKELQTVEDLLADDLSRKTFDNVVNFKLSGNIHYLTDVFSEKEEVFDHILQLGNHETYLDLGAYRGDTIEEFLRHTNGNYNSITALEPDQKTFLKLKDYAKEMKNITLFQMGIWNEDTDLYFDASLGRGSSIKKDGCQPLAVTKIDTLFKRRTLTYLKLDVEGAEHMALLGGKNVIQRDKPKINIAAYHRSEDLFDLPLLIKSLHPDYQLYLRQHPHIPAWDLNFYCI